MCWLLIKKIKYFTEGQNFLITVIDQIYEVKTIFNWFFRINLQTFINLKFYSKLILQRSNLFTIVQNLRNIYFDFVTDLNSNFILILCSLSTDFYFKQLNAVKKIKLC